MLPFFMPSTSSRATEKQSREEKRLPVGNQVIAETVKLQMIFKEPRLLIEASVELISRLDYLETSSGEWRV